MPRSTMKAIIKKKWNVFSIKLTLPESGRRSKLHERERRKLVRDATKRFTSTLKQLQALITRSGHCVHVTTILQIFRKCVGKFHKIKRMQSQLSFAKTQPKDSEATWK